MRDGGKRRVKEPGCRYVVKPGKQIVTGTEAAVFFHALDKSERHFVIHRNDRVEEDVVFKDICGHPVAGIFVPVSGKNAVGRQGDPGFSENTESRIKPQSGFGIDFRTAEDNGRLASMRFGQMTGYGFHSRCVVNNNAGDPGNLYPCADRGNPVEPGEKTAHDLKFDEITKQG